MNRNNPSLSKRRKTYGAVMNTLMLAATGFTVALVVFLVLYVMIRGLPHITWELLSTAPSYLTERIGILPDILNTVYIVLATIVVVLPLGVGAAIYLTSMQPTEGCRRHRVRGRDAFRYPVHHLWTGGRTVLLPISEYADLAYGGR